MAEDWKADGVEALLSELEEVTDDISDVSWFDGPVLVIFIILFFLVALQFFTRYVLNDSVGWTEEIARYLLIMLGFVGSITCVRKGKHIYLEFFYRYLKPDLIKPITLAVEVCVFGFFGYLGFLGIQLAERTKAQSMVSVDLPKSIIYYTVVAACFAMTIVAAVRVYRYLKMPADDVAAERLDNIEQV